MKFEQISRKLIFDKLSFINAVKTVLACVIGFFVAHAFKYSMPQWVIITILVVMAGQYRLGGTLKRGYARLLATAIGAGVSMLLLLAFTEHFVLLDIVLFVVIGIFIYFGGLSKDYSYAYTLGAVTTVIILTSDNPNFHVALDRILEILSGVIIAITVSRFVFPVHASIMLRQSVAKTLHNLKKIFKVSIQDRKTFNWINMETDLEEQLFNNLTNQVVLLKEAIAESRHIKGLSKVYKDVHRYERRLLRCVYMLHYTLRMASDKFDPVVRSDEFKNFLTEIMNNFDFLSNHLERKNGNYQWVDLEPSFKVITQQLRKEMKALDFEEKNKWHAFLFCIEHLIRILNSLKKRVVLV